MPFRSIPQMLKYTERNNNSIQLTIDKEKLKYLDKDNYIVNLCADRIIFESTTDATKVTLAARKED
jgi:hypothetical protein